MRSADCERRTVRIKILTQARIFIIIIMRSLVIIMRFNIRFKRSYRKREGKLSVWKQRAIKESLSSDKHVNLTVISENGFFVNGEVNEDFGEVFSLLFAEG